MHIQKDLIRRVVMVCVGVFFMGFAISLLVYAAFGSDPCTCMNLGISSVLGLSLGMWQLSLNVIILLFMFLFSRHLIGIGTVINMVSIGFLVDFFRGIFAQIFPEPPTSPVRILVMLFAVVLLSFTAALYISPQLGVSPYDGLAFMIAEHLHVQFRWCRIVCDVIAVIIGWLCGSVVGVGTVLTAFFMGPLIKNFIDMITDKFLPAAEQPKE